MDLKGVLPFTDLSVCLPACSSIDIKSWRKPSSSNICPREVLSGYCCPVYSMQAESGCGNDEECCLSEIIISLWTLWANMSLWDLKGKISSIQIGLLTCNNATQFKPFSQEWCARRHDLFLAMSCASLSVFPAILSYSEWFSNDSLWFLTCLVICCNYWVCLCDSMIILWFYVYSLWCFETLCFFEVLYDFCC